MSYREQRMVVDLGQHGHQTRQHHSFGCGHKGHVGHYHLSAVRPMVQTGHGAQGQCQRIEPAAHTHTMRSSQPTGILVFESLTRFAQQIPTALHHALHGLGKLWFEAGIDGL